MATNRLSKEDIQKIVLGVILFLFVIYAYFTYMLAPLSDEKETLEVSLDDLKTKIVKADATLRDLQRTERNAKNSTEIYAQIKELTPDGSPIVWVPLRLRDFFTRYNLTIAQPSSLGSSDVEDSLVQNFSDSRWGIEIPEADFVSLGNAIAAYENAYPLAKFTEVRILTSPDDPEFQRASLTTSLRLYENP